MVAVAPSIAAMWSATAANASANDPDAVISRAGKPDRHSGISAGTSIMPAPCALAIANEHSASPASAAPRRSTRGKRPETWIAATKNASPPASQGSSPRAPMAPTVASNATSAMEAAWPAAMGASARQAFARSPPRGRPAATTTQPVAGLSPCSAPMPASASQGPAPVIAAAQAREAQQDAAGASAAS